MRQVTGEALWLGNAGDSRDLEMMLAAGIRALVDLAEEEPIPALTRDHLLPIPPDRRYGQSTLAAAGGGRNHRAAGPLARAGARLLWSRNEPDPMHCRRGARSCSRSRAR
jgi:hypothetical protein